ncbi:hypothetical protein HanXRQr2_Chr07g0288021 [Helianthus annuus]|uniref:Uncharacterized protein n=1 Tax=Helianthus annuus TaxID=4232 RepID=A0A9K3IKJ4_HELAN|nr:hypothetical protein HanXRQr2_Chr07g0288021 [Helianthus annuus]KAJ0904167.1 hypothetical protein HanPSC8_Chr07g0278791 [Helianthus annuus]
MWFQFCCHFHPKQNSDQIFHLTSSFFFFFFFVFFLYFNEGTKCLVFNLGIGN